MRSLVRSGLKDEAIGGFGITSEVPEAGTGTAADPTIAGGPEEGTTADRGLLLLSFSSSEMSEYAGLAAFFTGVVADPFTMGLT